MAKNKTPAQRRAKRLSERRRRARRRVERGQDGPAICHHCGEECDLVAGVNIYPHRQDLGRKLFWLCRDCGAHVGCVGDTRVPLGTAANEKLRAARTRAYYAMLEHWYCYDDPRRKGMVYSYVAGVLGVSASQLRVGTFGLEQCRRVVAACKDREMV